MVRTLLIMTVCLVLPVAAMAQNAQFNPQGDFKNVFSPPDQAQQPGQTYQAPAPQPAVPPMPGVVAPVIIPTVEPKPAVVKPPLPDLEIDLPPEISQMVKDYDAAIKKLSPEQQVYVENIVYEGSKLDEPLHDQLIKSMDWKMCQESSLVTPAAIKDYERYKEREEQVYLENVAAFNNGVLANIPYIDPEIVKKKIAAQGVISMTTMKQLYLADVARASSDKIRYDCETLIKFLKQYNEMNVF
jgi:hypothetical protein